VARECRIEKTMASKMHRRTARTNMRRTQDFKHAQAMRFFGAPSERIRKIQRTLRSRSRERSLDVDRKREIKNRRTGIGHRRTNDSWPSWLMPSRRIAHTPMRIVLALRHR
jgi:hypothetical protein